jgi:hypothetical protein
MDREYYAHSLPVERTLRIGKTMERGETIGDDTADVRERRGP